MKLIKTESRSRKKLFKLLGLLIALSILYTIRLRKRTTKGTSSSAGSFNSLLDYDSDNRNSGNYNTRTIPDSDIQRVKKVFEIYKQFSVQNEEIIQTNLKGTKIIQPSYIPTYPHEWTVNMVKDALLLNLNLALKLQKYGLSLNSMTLNSTIYNYSHPLYVDILSISPEEMVDHKRLEQQYVSILRTFTHLAEGNLQLARSELKASTLSPDSIQDNPSVLTKEYQPQTNYTQRLISLLEQVSSTSVGRNPHPDAYPSKYYERKNENFAFDDSSKWLPKQTSLNSIFRKYRPQRVLDIGCNTGWFSILAERRGAKVVAIDYDEAVIDDLYLFVKRHNLNILPLKMSFEELSWNDEKGHSSNLERLRGDMTICLALIHHLILHFHLSTESVMSTLANSTTNILVLEVPSLQDELITSQPDFYSLSRNVTLSQYSLEAFVKEGWKYFRTVTVFPSHPHTRTLLVFEK